MPTITIYGASDDLVEVEGTVSGCDEYGGGDEPRFIVCEPSGDRFSVVYGNEGVWTVEHVHASGALTVSIVKAVSAEDEDYTDRATIAGPIDRVNVWHSWPPVAEDYAMRIARAFDLDDDRIDIRRGITEAQVIAAWRALGCP